MNGTEIVPVKRHYDTSIDNYLTELCVNTDMGTLVRIREHACDVKAITVSNMIFNAILEKDVDLIKTLVTRIDGLVPDEDKRGGYANILGDALEDVLSYENKEHMTITPGDPVIIAIAKVLVWKAIGLAGGNQLLRKERNLAAQIILERVGGRKTGPTKPALETKYVKPAWMMGEGDDGAADS